MFPRRSIILGKKRGERRTGSNALGRAALGLFAAVFFTAGIISLAFILLKLSIPEWRVNHQFVQAPCQVVEARVGTDNNGLTRPEILIKFKVGDRDITTWNYFDIHGGYHADEAAAEELLRNYPPGQEAICWFDPYQPETAVMVRGYSWYAWLMLLLPAAFISLGGGSLAYALMTWGKSTERIAAAGPHPPGLDFFLPATVPADQPFPFVPDSQNLNNSPGTILAYRLPPGFVGLNLAAIAIVSVLWNLAVIIFARMAIQSFRAGEPDWWLTAFVVPLALVGLLCLAWLARAVMITTGIGPTLVEISAHPLVPGGAYEVYLSQAGRLKVKSLHLQLVCEETATYRQGTNTRRATRRVYEDLLVSREAFSIGQGLPFEARAQLEIPAQAMHSFTANHNRIDWKLVMRGQVSRWPDFERIFPLVVRPRAATGGSS